MGRIMSIWMPRLPLDRRKRLSDPRLGGAFAIVREIKNALRLTHLTEQAANAGLTSGMSIPDARAICPDLLTEKADPVREGALLRALRRWADRLSPQVALDKPCGLFLNVSGCAHLFGGEEAMGAYIIEQLSDMQITARVGIADTKLAARALAQFSGPPMSAAPAGQTGAALFHMPLEGLGLPSKTCGDLKRAGLKTIGDLQNRKTSELARRFGLGLTQSFNAAMGYVPDPICAQAIDPVYAARMTLPDPIGLKDDLDAVLSRLTASVSSRLKTAQTGARNFRLTVRCVDTGDHDLVVGFARPTFEPDAIRQQFLHPLETLKIEFGADWFRLVATNLEPLQPKQMIMGEEELRASEDYAKMLSTLGNRLGFDRVRMFSPEDSHVPELECRSVEADGNIGSDAAWPKSSCVRPERLFRRSERINVLHAGRPPQSFQWRGHIYTRLEEQGPERVTPDWWRPGDNRTRDYWTVRTQCGSRFWLMTHPAQTPPEWFIAGQFL